MEQNALITVSTSKGITCFKASELRQCSRTSFAQTVRRAEDCVEAWPADVEAHCKIIFVNSTVTAAVNSPVTSAVRLVQPIPA